VGACAVGWAGMCSTQAREFRRGGLDHHVASALVGRGGGLQRGVNSSGASGAAIFVPGAPGVHICVLLSLPACPCLSLLVSVLAVLACFFGEAAQQRA